jgi:hypothetical protein
MPPQGCGKPPKKDDEVEEEDADAMEQEQKRVEARSSGSVKCRGCGKDNSAGYRFCKVCRVFCSPHSFTRRLRPTCRAVGNHPRKTARAKRLERMRQMRWRSNGLSKNALSRRDQRNCA